MECVGHSGHMLQITDLESGTLIPQSYRSAKSLGAVNTLVLHDVLTEVHHKLIIRCKGASDGPLRGETNTWTINKKLLVTSASLVVTGALLYSSNKKLVETSALLVDYQRWTSSHLLVPVSGTWHGHFG